MDNHEHWSVPEKGLQRAKKNRVYWDFSFPFTLFHFLPAKIRQILFQIILRLLQIFLPDTLHNIVMQCPVPGLRWTRSASKTGRKRVLKRS